MVQEEVLIGLELKIFKKGLKTSQVKWHISGNKRKIKFSGSSFGVDTEIARSNLLGVPKIGP